MKMSRNEKLFNRLDELKSDYQKMIIQELEGVLKGSHSQYFRRKENLFEYGPKALGKFWQNKETASIEKLEKEILSLADKLNEPSSSDLCHMIDKFIEERAKLSDRFEGGEEALARRYLNKLKSTI